MLAPIGPRGLSGLSSPPSRSPGGLNDSGAPFMHYPHRISRIKRKRAIGFRARMQTKNGRKLMNRKRRAGRSLNVADK